MNRRGILKALGFAPVAAPFAMAGEEGVISTARARLTEIRAMRLEIDKIQQDIEALWDCEPRWRWETKGPWVDWEKKVDALTDWKRTRINQLHALERLPILPDRRES